MLISSTKFILKKSTKRLFQREHSSSSIIWQARSTIGLKLKMRVNLRKTSFQQKMLISLEHCWRKEHVITPIITTDGVNTLTKNNNSMQRKMNNKILKFPLVIRSTSMTEEMIILLCTDILEIIRNLSLINKDLKFFSFSTLMEFHL